MKNFVVYGFFAVGLIAAAVFMRMGRAPEAPVAAVAQEAAADQMPPVPTADNGPYINAGRLQKLADSNYKGPSFKEDYSKAEYMMAAKKRLTDRLPASNGNGDTNAQPAKSK